MSKKQERKKTKDATELKNVRSEDLMDVELKQNVESPDYDKVPVYIYSNWCKRCGICVAFCPKGVLAQRKDGTPFVKFPEKCIGCKMCEFRCPDFAITVVKKNK